MKCYFCRQEIPNAFQFSDETRSDTTRMYGVCQKCPHVCSTYSQLEDLDKIGVAIISFDYKEITYKAYFDVENNKFNLKCWQQDYLGNWDLSPVMSLYFTPKNITPHNIIKKLPSLILYS